MTSMILIECVGVGRGGGEAEWFLLVWLLLYS